MFVIIDIGVATQARNIITRPIRTEEPATLVGLASEPIKNIIGAITAAIKIFVANKNSHAKTNEMKTFNFFVTNIISV
jgi:hypothetical protein